MLKGVHTIVMESSNGYDVEGFYFERRSREFSENRAADCERIYGDKFTVTDDAVIGIGNNVMLDFGEFDFEAEKPSALVITGKSAIPLNSITMIFSGDTEKRMLCEFTGADEYTERRFELDGITGKRKVSFAFLPGSDFDFKSFRFEK